MDQRERYRQARRNGLCGHCLTRRAYKHFSQCEECYFDPKRRVSLVRANAKLRPPEPCAFPNCPRTVGIRHKYCGAHEQQQRRGEKMTQVRPSNGHTGWTREDFDTLVRMHHAGRTAAEIASAIRLSQSKVESKLSRYKQQRAMARMSEATISAPLRPYPGVARCRCGLALDDDHRECDMPSIYAVAARRAAW